MADDASRPRSNRPPHRSDTPQRRKPRDGEREAEGERLQKILAHAGLGSRRTCEEFILQGRVTVDGAVVRQLGTRVCPDRQRVAVDGQLIRPERFVYFAVYKPKGYVSTNRDPAGRPRVIDLLPEGLERVFSVGRLDESSTGLILLTNDGALANRLAHPRYGVEKVYRAVVAGAPTTETLEQLIQGVWLAEGKARARRVRVIGKQGEATILELVLAEGKNREVRRVLAKVGHKVMSLTRVAVGPISIKGLKVGQWRHLTAREVDQLRRTAEGIPVSPSRTRLPQIKAPRRGPRRPDRLAEPPTSKSASPIGPRPEPRRKIIGVERPASPRKPGPAKRSRPGRGQSGQTS